MSTGRNEPTAAGVNEFDHPLVAASYDIVDGPRDDLDLYRTIIDEVGAASVLDVGCGTGELAISLAAAGIDVVGLEPAGAMLAVARAKAGADAVTWVHGEVSALPELAVDVAVMTGNVAQVFIDEADWVRTLRGIHDALRQDGLLVFESRIPQRRVWQEWAAQTEPVRYSLPGVGDVVETFELTVVSEPLVTFRSHMHLPDGSVHTAESTLIFRTLVELEQTLDAAGFVVDEVRDAPDRPDREWVVLARKATRSVRAGSRPHGYQDEGPHATGFTIR